jgi:hypothetical protein
MAQKAYLLLKAQIIRGLSIGYDTIQASFVGDVRHLQELMLWECSIVTFAMNESAQVASVKSLSDEDRGRHLTAINEHRKSIDHHQRAIRMHLKSMMDDLDDDDSNTDLVDNPALIESDEGDDEDDKAFVIELQKLAEQAAELATK